MELVRRETCRQYIARRLSEGWRITDQKGFHVILQSPEGIVRPVDIRNDIETLRPSGEGDECNIRDETGASCPWHWQNVDEESPDEWDSVVKEYGDTYHRDLYNLPASSGIGTINKITVYVRCVGDSGA